MRYLPRQIILILFMVFSIGSFASTQTVQGEFIETKTIEGFAKPLVSQGRFEIRENYFSWSVEKPLKSTLVWTPKGITFTQNGHASHLNSQDSIAMGAISEVISGLAKNDLSQASRLFSFPANASLANGPILGKPKASFLKPFIHSIEIEKTRFCLRDTQGITSVVEIRIEKK